MSTNIHERSSIFAPDISTIDDVNAPDDELSGTATVAKNTRQINQHQKQQRQRHNDDEYRIPPPIDTSSPSLHSPSSPIRHHPDFASWKRDTDAMTDVLKDKKSSVQITDRKTARINKRKQKELKHQLQCATSDVGDVTLAMTNSTCRSTCDDDDQSSVETTYSSSMLEDNHFSSTVGKFTDIIGMKKCRSEPFLAGNRSRSLSLERKSRKERDEVVIRQMHTDRPLVTPIPAPTLRTISSVIPPPLPPRSSGPPNTKELAAIMFELADLKAWATAATTSMTNNKTSSTLPTSSLSLSTPLLSTFSSSKKQEKPSLQPPLSSTKNESESKEKRKEQHKEHEYKEYKEKKSVQFTHPLITDTIYRPKTPREEVNILFFQEEELLDWENDEETTVRDRFEIVVAEIDETTYDTASPVISFHNSYSYSFQEDDSDDEYESENSSYDVDDRH